VSAGVSLPIFNGQARASVDGAEANLRSAEAQMAELELSVRREIEQQYLAFAEADERITVAQTGEDSARVSLAAAEARYAEGLAIVIEVTDADQSLREAQASRVQALYDYNLAHTRLLSAVGADLLQVMGAQ
jgi:outer membrane protein